VYTNASLKERKSITTQNQAVIQNECGIGSIVKNYDDTKLINIRVVLQKKNRFQRLVVFPSSSPTIFSFSSFSDPKVPPLATFLGVLRPLGKGSSIGLNGLSWLMLVLKPSVLDGPSDAPS
jgi:hypothetical protein